MEAEKSLLPAQTELTILESKKQEEGEQEVPVLINNDLEGYMIDNIDLDKCEVKIDKTPRKGMHGFITNIGNKLNCVKGYTFGLLFTICACMSNVLIKMAPSLNSFNHSMIRYILQLFIMIYFIVNRNESDFLGPKSQRKLLTLRGLAGCCALIFGFYSLKYLDVSDVETLINSCVLITALLSRIFLKEKITICHIFSLILTITGVLFIIRPAFLFGIENDLEGFFHVNVTAHNLNSTRVTEGYFNRSLATTLIGLALVFTHALCTSISQVSIRKLCLDKVHHSIISIYPVFIGLPLSVIVSVLLTLPQDAKLQIIPIEIFYSFCAGLISTFGLICLNKALKHEDAAKIAIVRTTGVLFSFLLQYLILDVEIDFLGILGAIFIVSGTLAIILTKIYGKSFNDTCKFLAIKF